MCRMFAYVGNSRSDLMALYVALRKASENDSLAEGTKHGDGWGYVIFSDSRLIHYRTEKAIYEDVTLELPAIEGTVHAVFHARKAGPNSSSGSPIFSHPFTAVTGNKALFLAHNGDLKVSVPEHSVDSEFALQKIIETGDLSTASGELFEVTDKVLNLFLLTIERSTLNARIEYINHWNEEEKGYYHKLYMKSMSGGSAVYSATMSESLGGRECRRDAVECV